MAIVAAPAALVAAGAIYQRIGLARDRRRFPPPGAFLDVGGHRLHVTCLGTDAPAVIFESGIAASSLSWTKVQSQVAAFTRSCAYDRAGLAWSDPPSTPRTFAHIVDDSVAVLSTVADSRGCILVGHSFGSFIARSVARRVPKRIAGLVLVDPPLEWLTQVPTRERLLRGAERLSRVGTLLAHLGVVRVCLRLLSGGAPAAPRNFVKIFGPTAARTLERLVGEVRKLPPELYPVVEAHWCQPKCFTAMSMYLRALAIEGPAIAAELVPPEIPVTVISSGTQPPEQIAAQRALAAMSVEGHHLVARESGHWVQFDEPAVIVDAVRRIAASRNDLRR